MTAPDGRPRLLDLFCGAGGAARGYQLAAPWPGAPRFAAIHASPPCQYHAAVTRWRGRAENHPELIAPTRVLLESVGVPWVMENVPGSTVRPDYRLCGSMFGLPVRRHRWFETSWRGFGLVQPCTHRRDDLPFMHKAERAFADAMGCTWMPKMEAREAIPPAYTQFVGEQLLAVLAVGR